MAKAQTAKDDTDWRTIALEERAEVKRLTAALVELATQPRAPAPAAAKPRPEKEPAPDGPRLPPRVVANLGKLEAQLRAANPGLSDDLYHAEAVRLAAENFPDAG